jgi:hypothetical protein
MQKEVQAMNESIPDEDEDIEQGVFNPESDTSNSASTYDSDATVPMSPL